MVNEYAPKDIVNLDKTSLFLKCFPIRTILNVLPLIVTTVNKLNRD